ncbi:phage tail terminator-like protein [Pararhizobium haloflavum]|uniref:phage tail terminator-like protein n=1 Tax=Pararhizobium haloflavum TaxID=2037914 RepID=UPI000C1991A0|nr:phage tail terminator-like protein [Pararhizobium haloflavum]
MAHFNVVQAVEARLEAGFNQCPIAIENDGDQTVPDTDTAFVMVQFPWSTSEWETIEGAGGCDFLEEGGIRFVLAVPAGRGTHRYRPWLDDIATLFRGQAFGGVQTFAPTSPTSDDRNDGAGYYRLSIVVPYQYLIQG